MIVKGKSKNPNDFFSAGFGWLQFVAGGNLTRSLSYSPPLYIISAVCQPLHQLFLKEFYGMAFALGNRRKSLVSKDLRFAGRAATALSRCPTRVYVNHAKATQERYETPTTRSE